jgi:hypothetical protein
MHWPSIREISFYYHVQTQSGACAALCSIHNGKLSPGTKLLKCKVEHSLPSDVKIKNM